MNVKNVCELVNFNKNYNLMKILNLRYSTNIKHFKKLSFNFTFTKISRKPYTLQTTKEEEKLLSEIRWKNKKAINSETEYLKGDSVSKFILKLKKRTEYDFELLNQVVDEFMSSLENKSNTRVVLHLIEILGYNNFFNSKIKDLLVDIMNMEDDNKIFILYSICYYINQINTSRRIILDFPQSFYQNIEKIFLDKGFLLNIKELSNIVKTLVKYNLYLSHTFFDYLERCIIHNFENRNNRNQSFNKDSITIIIQRYGSTASLTFLNKLFSLVKEYINSEEYLPEDTSELIYSCCSATYFLPKNDERLAVIKKMLRWTVAKYVESVNNSYSFNLAIFKHIYFQIIDNYQLFLDTHTNSFFGDDLFLPRLVEKVHHVNVNDVSLILNKINKRMQYNKTIYNQIEPLIKEHFHNINEWSDLYNFLNFYYRLNVVEPLVFKGFEAKFMLLVLNKKEIDYFSCCNLIAKYQLLYQKNKIYSNFFVHFLVELIDQMEMMSLENEKSEEKLEDQTGLEELQEEPKVAEENDNLDNNIEINKV
jgi:hypothetical protein